MKANQKFTQADEAVSPVIGVILMVAITVVLAAVVFVLVSDLGDSGEAAPQMSFSKNSSQGTITLVSAESGLNWNQFSVTTTSADGDPCNAIETSSAGSVSAGDTVASDCDSGDTVRVTHNPTNTLVYSTTF